MSASALQDRGSGCRICGAAVAAVLLVDAVCPHCRSEQAWSQFADRPLTISAADVAAAVSRRQPPGRAAAALLAHWLPATAAVAAAVASVWAGAALFSAVELGPFAAIRAELGTRALRVLAAAGAASALGITSLWLQRRRRYRQPVVAVAALVSTVTGLATGIVGATEFLSAVQSGGWAHFAMPDRTAAAGAPPHVQRIMDATVFVLAPESTGDARAACLGVGSVIHSEPFVTWILTCSHVAMPFAGSDGQRAAAGSPAVFVSFADGEEVEARVVWAAPAPLDVALLRAARERVAAAVAVRDSVDDFVTGSTVLFVPNPLRAGWLWHEGSVQRREPHLTPVGVYSLLFTDLPVAPGDSGSGLFDGDGRLVGINTWAVLDPDRRAGISLPAEAVQEIFQRIRPGAAASGRTRGESK